MTSPASARDVDVCVRAIRDKKATVEANGSELCGDEEELVLFLDNNEQRIQCWYYFASHGEKTVFWFDEMTAEDICPNVHTAGREHLSKYISG